MWLRYWNLHRDPFDDRQAPFIPAPGHVEARARLVHTVESAGRSASLIAPGGLGKSMVLRLALDAVRSPSRKIARAHDPLDGANLFASLARGLGGRIAPDAGRAAAWLALTESCRLCRWQGINVVLAVDGVETLESVADRRDLDRLVHIDQETRLTVLKVGRPTDQEVPGPPDGYLNVRLTALTRSETFHYLDEKLRLAGRADSPFTPTAMTRLHALAEGVPRMTDRLARFAMMAASARNAMAITPEEIEGAYREAMGYSEALAV